MMRTRDPRVRQTINQISHNLESANETAQEGIYTFSHNYILPCFAAIGNCVQSCTAPCFPSRENQLRRRRRRYAEFDFYDDWDNDDADDTILGWGTDELDRLLVGSGLARGSSDQPRRQRGMSYGARRTSKRKSGLLVPDDRNDPTVIPSSSFLGFLERFPWRFGARGIKYRPSAADLQEHPTGSRLYAHERSPLLETADEIEGHSGGANGRYRSSTQSSRETGTSLSSRGDLIPSDEEEDAVPLDDEFAVALTSRRGTGLESDDQGGDKPESMRSVSGTFSIAPTTSSRESKRKKKKKKKRATLIRSPQGSHTHDVAPVSIEDLKKEENEAEQEEESEVVRKRLAAQQLAMSRGIGVGNVDGKVPPAHQTSSITTTPETGNEHESISPVSSDDPRTEPFPPLPLTLPGPKSGGQDSDQGSAEQGDENKNGHALL